MTKISKAREQECKERLQELVKPGDTIYTVLKHVSRSGMYRVIDLYVMRDNQPVRISGYAADLLEGYDQRHEGCKASGCGMDMGFHLAYNLSYALYPEYDCMADLLGPKADAPYRYCPSPDHVNHGDCRSNTVHHDGYALRHQWM